VLMCDGSVRFLARDPAPALVRSHVTLKDDE
jgi:hypothetical protein